jgi:hypothetical protein
VVTVANIRNWIENALAEWHAVRVADLHYGHRDTTVLLVVALGGLSLAALVIRAARGPKQAQRRVALPALLDWRVGRSWSLGRHGALLLFVAGVPCFMMALADPYTAVAQRQQTYPGRRIALMIDASSSMLARFPTEHLGQRHEAGAPSSTAFFTTVAAAEIFVRQRMSGKYRDLMALIEFGDEAYVVTPFTTDYDGILLSLSLIGDWTEFMKFPDQGTTIGMAIEQGVDLFRSFDFLTASGNLMVLFTDGQDTQVTINGVSVQTVLAQAKQAKIPVYLIRTSFNKSLGGVVPDSIWKPAVEATGGRFYAASDESTILRAVHEIDQMSAGSISVTQYTTERPRFELFAGMGFAAWTLALALKLAVPYFQTFP